jgi:hypothetical protein
MEHEDLTEVFKELHYYLPFMVDAIFVEYFSQVYRQRNNLDFFELGDKNASNLEV